MQRITRVAAIHDLSGFGRCSLTVILPVLSVMGVQACPIPTAVLSTHTGGFGEVEFRDLTDFLMPCLDKYIQLDINFECIYTGFLGSAKQIDHCLEFFKAYPKATIVVDPVMGDHGKAYRTYTPEMQKRMSELIAKAHIITPNVTETYMLLGEVYENNMMTHSKAKSLLARLGEKGPEYVVITGVQLGDKELCNIGYDKKRNAFWYVVGDYIPVSYPGTGDIFSSVLIGGILTGDSLPIAMDRATRFVEIAIKTTFSYGTDTRHGVMLEKSLAWLTQNTVLKNYYNL